MFADQFKGNLCSRRVLEEEGDDGLAVEVFCVCGLWVLILGVSIGAYGAYEEAVVSARESPSIPRGCLWEKGCSISLFYTTAGKKEQFEGGGRFPKSRKLCALTPQFTKSSPLHSEQKITRV